MSMAVAALVLGGVGLGQAQTDATGMHKADDDAMMVQPLNVSVDDIEAMDIYGTGDQEIGEIKNVLVDGSGQPVAVSADVGGLLGVGQRTVIIGLDRLSKTGDRLMVSMSKEEIEALPEFEED
jgi:hypothetical protein